MSLARATHPAARHLLGASVWLLADRGLRLGVSFLVSVLIARSYGPEAFGQINFIVAVAAMFNSIASLGLEDILPRDLAQNDFVGMNADDAQHTALRLRLWSGTAAYVVLLLVVGITYGWGELLLIAAVLGPYFLFTANDVHEYRLRVDGRFAAIAKTHTLASLVSNSLKLWVIWALLPIAWLAAAMTAEFACNSLLLRRIARARTAWGRGTFRADYAKHLLGRSWKIMLAGVLVMAQLRVEYFLVEYLLGWESVGQFAAAFKIVEIFDVVTSVLMSILLPEFARKYRAAPAQTMRYGYLIGSLAVLALIPVMIAAVWAFPLVYGAPFAPASAVLSLFMLRPFFMMLIAVRHMFLVIEHRLWYPPFCAGIGVVTALGFGLWLIPELGLVGAVWAAVLSLLASTLLVDALFNRKNLTCFLSCWRETKAMYRKIHNV